MLSPRGRDTIVFIIISRKGCSEKGRRSPIYRVAICEDEAPIREALLQMCRELLSQLAPEHQVEAFASARELAQALADDAPFDLLCLDILMEGQNGMEFAQKLREENERISILFITGSSQYLKDGYSVRPIQYLFKPVQREELEDALRTDLRLHHRPRTLTLRTDNKTTVLPIQDILYLESQNHWVVVHMREGQQTFRSSLSEVERLLPPDQFCRSHNSYLVNMAWVAQTGRRELLLQDGSQVPVSREYYESMQRQFVRFLNLK